MLSNLPDGVSQYDIDYQCGPWCIECGRLVYDTEDEEPLCARCGEKEEDV